LEEGKSKKKSNLTTIVHRTGCAPLQTLGKRAEDTLPFQKEKRDDCEGEKREMAADRPEARLGTSGKHSEKGPLRGRKTAEIRVNRPQLGKKRRRINSAGSRLKGREKKKKKTKKTKKKKTEKP